MSQNIKRVRSTIEKLSSSDFSGRGYVNDGALKTAEYLKSRMKKARVKPLGKVYEQVYFFNVNTFPGNMDVIADGKHLTPGIHYLVSPESNSISGKFDLKKIDSLTWTNSAEGKEKLYVQYEKKLTWSVSPDTADYSLIQLLKDSFSVPVRKMELNIEQKLIQENLQENICGQLKGRQVPDSFIVISAHFDHLGKMGKNTIFRGANDNASGVSMLLELAEYFSKVKTKYTIVFLLFSGEEAGLLGSHYFVKNPLVSLERIKFLINLDLLGTGDEGITVVNASEYPDQFKILQRLNDNKKLLPTLKPRGKAMNSDHFWFTEAGVPSFFIYTLGGIKAYHDVYDIPSTLPLSKFKEVYSLLKEFILQF